MRYICRYMTIYHYYLSLSLEIRYSETMRRPDDSDEGRLSVYCDFAGDTRPMYDGENRVIHYSQLQSLFSSPLPSFRRCS